MRALGLDSGNIQGATFQKGKGCGNCSNTGYRGRFGIFEIFVIDDDARKLIYEKVSSSVLRTRAREMGMRTLREDGIRRSEEHTSELQSHSDLVCRLLLEKNTR